MKYQLTLVIASALFLTACSSTSTLDVPPSMRASLPPIPAQIDVDPEPLGQLRDGEMGTVTVDSAEMSRKYGALGVRFNTLREFYECVREAANTQGNPEDCLT